MNEVVKGIYQIKLPLVHSALGIVNTYLIKGNDGYLLVDTGWNIPEAFEALKEQMAEIGARLEDISRIVITHVHADHYGMAGRIKEISHADIAVHRLEKEVIEKRYVNIALLLEQLGDWLGKNGVPDSELPRLQVTSTFNTSFVLVTPPDIILDGGDTISWGNFNFRVLWTPGHALGHICLYEQDKKILLSGDFILPNITPHISLNPYQAGTNPLEDYLRSLGETRKLEADIVLPGHEQVFHDMRGRIDEIIRHHEMRNSEILGNLNRREKTAYEIATQLTWMSDVGGRRWESLPALDRRLAALETLSHLEYLRYGGKVASSVRDDIIYYQAI